MKFFAHMAVAAFVFFCISTVRAAETAHARIWCLSLRFQQGQDSFGDTLDLSTISSTSNGELAPYNGLTYISGFTLDISGLPINGTMQINLPPAVDQNGNGFNDFFESALGVAATTSGQYNAGPENGSVTAAWQRPAGSQNGTCVLHLVDSIYGDLGSFTHSFELIEYAGPLLFTPGTNRVTGSLSLTQTGNSANQLGGPVQFSKVATNRFDLLVLQAGTWTNNAAQMLSFTNDSFHRDAPWTTNYYGFVEFSDGDPNTAESDYLVWLLSIDDSNDANKNGVPDFSDDPQASPTSEPPQLALGLGSTNLSLSLSGTVGHSVDVQEALSFPATNWQTVLSVTLTNDPQVLVLPHPAVPAAFWRAVAH